MAKPTWLGSVILISFHPASLLSGVIVAADREVVGALVIRDPLRPEAAVVIEALRNMGISSVMLTGDNKRTAFAVAKEVSSLLALQLLSPFCYPCLPCKMQ